MPDTNLLKLFRGNIDNDVIVKVLDPEGNAQNFSGFATATLLIGKAAQASSVLSVSMNSHDVVNGIFRWRTTSSDLGSQVTLGNYDAFVKIQMSSGEIKTFPGATVEITAEPGPSLGLAPLPINVSFGSMLAQSATINVLLVTSGMIVDNLSAIRVNVSGLLSAGQYQAPTNLSASGIVTKLVAGTNISLDPSGGTGVVQINATDIGVAAGANTSFGTMVLGSTTINAPLVAASGIIDTQISSLSINNASAVTTQTLAVLGQASALALTVSGLTSLNTVTTNSASLTVVTNQSSFFGQAGVFGGTLSSLAATVSGLLNTGQIQAPTNLSNSGIVTKLIAGSNIGIDPASGTGVVTISTGGAGGGSNTSFGTLFITSATINRLTVQSGEIADQISTIQLNVSGISVLNTVTASNLSVDTLRVTSATIGFLTNQSGAVIGTTLSTLQLNVSGNALIGGTLSALALDASGSITANQYLAQLATNASGAFTDVDNSAAFWNLEQAALSSFVLAGTVQFYRERGTAATKRVVLSGDTLGSMEARGQGSAGFLGSSNIGLFLKANATFTDSANPTILIVETTNVSTITRAEVGRFTGSGFESTIIVNASSLFGQVATFGGQVSALAVNVSGLAATALFTANSATITDLTFTNAVGTTARVAGQVSAQSLTVSGLTTLNIATANSTQITWATVLSRVTTVDQIITGTLSALTENISGNAIIGGALSAQAVTVSGLLKPGLYGSATDISNSLIVTKIIAGSNIGIDPASGVGVVTISTGAGGGGGPSAGSNTSWGTIVELSTTITRLVVQSGELADQISTIALNVSGLAALNVATGNSATFTVLTNTSNFFGMTAALSTTLGIGITTNISDQLHLTGLSAQTINIEAAVQSAFDYQARFIAWRTRGTLGTKRVVTSGDVIFSLEGRGQGSAGYLTSSIIAIAYKAADTFNDSSQPAFITLEASNVSSISRTEVARFTGSGGQIPLLVNVSSLFGQAGIFAGTLSTLALNVSGLSTLNTVTATGNVSALSLNLSGSFTLNYGTANSTAITWLTNVSRITGQDIIAAGTLSALTATISGLGTFNIFTANSAQVTWFSTLSRHTGVDEILIGTLSARALTVSGLATLAVFTANSGTIGFFTGQSGAVVAGGTLSALALTISGLTTLNYATGNSAGLTWITNVSRLTGQDIIAAGTLSALTVDVSGLLTAAQIATKIATTASGGIQLTDNSAAFLSIEAASLSSYPLAGTLEFYRERGTSAAKRVVISGDVLAEIGIRGQASAGFFGSANVAILGRAIDTFNDSSMPSVLAFETTNISTNSRVEIARFTGSGLTVNVLQNQSGFFGQGGVFNATLSAIAITVSGLATLGITTATSETITDLTYTNARGASLAATTAISALALTISGLTTLNYATGNSASFTWITNVSRLTGQDIIAAGTLSALTATISGNAIIGGTLSAQAITVSGLLKPGLYGSATDISNSLIVTKIVAGANIGIDPASGVGVVTISTGAGGGGPAAGSNTSWGTLIIASTTATALFIAQSGITVGGTLSATAITISGNALIGNVLSAAIDGIGSSQIGFITNISGLTTTNTLSALALTVSGNTIIGGSLSAGTFANLPARTVGVPVQWLNAGARSGAGYSFWTVTQASAWDVGHWEFLGTGQSDGWVNGIVTVPNNFASSNPYMLIAFAMSTAVGANTSNSVSVQLYYQRLQPKLDDTGDAVVIGTLSSLTALTFQYSTGTANRPLMTKSTGGFVTLSANDVVGVMLRRSVNISGGAPGNLEMYAARLYLNVS